jgi:uncharacterized protein (TIGR02118 family)
VRKIMLYQKRSPGGDRQAFFQSALREQALVLQRMPGLRRLVVSLEAEGKDETFDAATELEFADAQAVTRALASEAGERALATMRANASRVERVDLVPHPLFNTGQSAPFKLIVGLKRRADLTRGDFEAWWLDRHAPYVVKFPELRRYQVNLVEDGPEAFVDGTAEVCFADLAALQRVMSTAHVKEVQHDSQVHTQARYRFFVEEHVLLGAAA